jgi:NADH:ubiquinone oxidoreductase subunit E
MKSASIYERIEYKMKVTVCIGSSCHIKGSRQVVEKLQSLIKENNLEDKVEIGGTFCLGKCQQGVCVTVDEEFHSVTPENVNEFFENEIAKKV